MSLILKTKFEYSNFFKVLQTDQLKKHKIIVYSNPFLQWILKVIRWLLIRIPSKKFIIKCFGGLLLVNKFEVLNQLKKGQIFGNGNKTIRSFSRNNQGNFDITE